MDIALRIALVIPYFIHWVVRTIYSTFFDEKRQCLPSLDDKLLMISATELADKIRRREVSSEEVVKAYIKRIQAVNPIINAVVDDRFSAAIVDAKRIDDFLEKSKPNPEELAKKQPLLGLPITIKETIAVKDMSFTLADATRKGVKATEDSDAVQLVKEAGAVILVVSNTPEYPGLECTNFVTGRTRNPYNTKCTAGGSTGGEGALLGAGASLIGLGSDLAGSIRFPSAFNGIFGHKPSARTVPLKNCFPCSTDERFNDYMTIGPMARYVQDLTLVYRVLAGKNLNELSLDMKVDINVLKVFYMTDSYSNFGFPKMDRDIQNAIKASVQHLTNNFKCELDETKFEMFGYGMEISTALLYSMDDDPSPFANSEKKYSLPLEILKFIVGKSIFTGQVLFFTASMALGKGEKKKAKFLKKAEEDKQLLKAALGDNGVLIIPICAAPAFGHHGFIKAMVDVRFTGPINVLGFPATCVPTGLNKNGMPIGIQIIAAPHNDHLSLAVAAELSKYFGGWQPPN